MAAYVDLSEQEAVKPPGAGKGCGAARKDKAKLSIAKLDRLTRNVAFITTKMDAGAIAVTWLSNYFFSRSRCFAPASSAFICS